VITSAGVSSSEKGCRILKLQQDGQQQKELQEDRQYAWDTLMDHRVELDASGMTAVAHELGEHARLVEQQAGRGVWVPPGWLHLVYNIQSCFNIAFEVCPISHVAACCHMQQCVRFSFDSGEDYMQVPVLLLAQLKRWYKWSRG
jgi:hypothetical protein